MKKERNISQYRELLATATGSDSRFHSAIVLICGFVFSIGVCFVLKPEFEYHGNSGVVGWISANEYPKKQEIFYFIGSLFFVPFFTAVIWGLWVSLSNVVSLLTGLPSRQLLKKYAFAYLPLILALQKIHTPTFTRTLLIPAIISTAVKIAFLLHDLSLTRLRRVREAIFRPGSADQHWSVFASGVCAGFFVLIGYTDNAMGLLPCLKIMLTTATLVWLFWPLYSKALSAIAKRPFEDVLADEVHSNFPLVILLSIALFYGHRNAILTISLALMGLVKIGIIIRPGWFEKVRSTQLHRYILEYALIPVLIYAFFYSGGNIHGDIDMFHEGEKLAPLNALLRGKIPYRDIYLQHGLFFNAYRPLLAAKLFGTTLAADRMLGHMLAPLGYMALYILGLQVLKNRFFILFSIWIMASGVAPASDRQALGLVSMAILLGYLFSQRRRLLYKFHLRPVLAGVCTTLAIFYSLEMGLYTLATGSLFLLVSSISVQNGIRERSLPILSYLAGTFTAFLPFALYFGIHGALDDLFRNSFIQCAYQLPTWGLKFPPLFPELSNVTSLESLRVFVLSETFKWYLPILIYLITLTYLMYQLLKGGFWGRRSNIILLLLVMGGAIFFRTPLGRSDIWHLHNNTLFAWLICAILIENLSIRAWKSLTTDSNLLPTAAWWLFLVVILAWYIVSLYNPIDMLKQRSLALTGYQNIQRDVKPPLARAGKIKILAEQASQVQAVVEYIQGNTTPDETIFDFSSQGAYYFFADRPMANRYHQVCYAATEDMQKEVIADLEKHRTKLVIFTTGSWFDNIDDVASVDRHPLIARYLEENYTEADKVGNVTMLKRKGSGLSVNSKTAATSFEQMVSKLKDTFPGYFLEDAVVAQSDDIERPMVFGEPDPPEGFAGPDPTGKHPFGIYVPVKRDEFFKDDISLEQWIFHEMFHLHNRRTREYDPYIDKAFPDDNDPLVQWLMKDPYHRTFAREEAFINLISFADPARTAAQKEAVRTWFDYIGAEDKSIDEIRKILNVIKHW
ncbi:hypothetical protein ACFL6S_05965 [Candidatus Poribacteria bacterium]